MEQIDFYEIVIDKPFSEVKKFFLDEKNWEKWFTCGMKNAQWRINGVIQWETGENSVVRVFKSTDEELAILIEENFMQTKYILQERRRNNQQTIFHMEDETINGASFSDGGKAHREQLQQTIRAFGEVVEKFQTKKRWFIF